MNFGEKLYKLRKEKGFSQEELAAQLNSSRQAISKWENGQGFPETEKLLMLGTIFEVSIDYLLKESSGNSRESNAGYYVSKEMAEGYILSEKKTGKSIALAAMFLFLSGIPYILLQDNKEIQIVVMIIFIALGLMTIIIAALKEETKYKVLKQEPLLFDKVVLKDLQDKNNCIGKRYTIIAGLSIFIIIVAAIPFVLTSKRFGVQVPDVIYAFSFMLLAFGFFGFIMSITIIEAYRLLARNEEHANKLHIKIMRKIRKSID